MKIKFLLIITTFIFCSVASLSQEPILYFAVTHHIVLKSDSTGGQDAAMIPLIMDELNKAFAPARIQFYMSCVGIDTITIYNIFLKTIISQKKRIFVKLK